MYFCPKLKKKHLLSFPKKREDPFYVQIQLSMETNEDISIIVMSGENFSRYCRLKTSFPGLPGIQIILQEKVNQTLPWLKKNAFLARILQDFLSRSCKIMHFSARHLARILQERKFPCKILPRRKISWKVLDKIFFIFIVFDFKLTTASLLLDSVTERGLFARGFNHQRDANSRKYL